MKKERSKNAGITLIAMIITIIVMLVLAGVSMNAIIGDNGILTKAISAVDETEEAELWEQIQTILVEAYSQDFENDDKFVNYVNDKFEVNGISDVAVIRISDEGYCLIYGRNTTKIAYLDYNLSVIKNLEAVIGDPSIWILDKDAEGNVKQNEDGTVTIVRYNGSETELTIPNVIDGYIVSTLGNQVFYNQPITSVTFSEGITTIGEGVFQECGNLTTVSNLPSTLVTIGKYAFYECSSLSSTITFTSSIKSVGEEAFSGCSNINGTVENLIRTSVSYGLKAFYGCSNLKGDVNVAMSAFLTETDEEIPDNLFSGWKRIGWNNNDRK